MSYPYGTWIKSIKDSLIAVVKTATSFSEHTYADYVKEVAGNPTAFVRLRRDDVTDIGPVETRHIITFEIQVIYRGSHREASLDKVIEHVGEIVDAIEADRDLSNSYVLNTEVVLVDYTFRATESAVIHYGQITCEAEVLRNV